MDDASPIGLFEVKASRRPGALEQWIAARESLAAAQVVIDELAPLLTARMSARASLARRGCTGRSVR